MSKPASIPLAAPNGEVLTYACGLCLRVCASRSSWGPPTKKQRASLAESHKADADGCCVCRECKKVEKGAMGRCKACDAVERAEMAAQRESEEAKSADQATVDAARDRLFWARSDARTGPIATIVSSRYGWEGANWLAFPGLPDEVPGDAFSDDPESHEFWTSGEAQFVGRGSTPSEALADLVRIANEHAPKKAADGGAS